MTESCLYEWQQGVLNDCESAIQRLKKKRYKRKCILTSPKIKTLVENLQKDFVFVPTDKASNNIAIVCKRFYVEQSLRELDIFLEHKEENLEAQTYMATDEDVKSIIKRHIAYMTSKSIDQIPEDLPFLYWIPKMHKKPFSKQRYIAASHNCSTKPLSAIMTKILSLVERQHRLACQHYENNHGINPMWIIHSSTKVQSKFATFNRKKECNNLRTYDFSTLYTCIPHSQLKDIFEELIKDAFKSAKHDYISVYKTRCGWTTRPKDKTLAFNCDEVCEMLKWLIDNIYVTFGNKVFRQCIGIPMGTDCAPFLANLFLFYYEFKWLDKQRIENPHRLKFFKSCCRYIDDLFLVNNNDLMKKYMLEIYPKELNLIPDETDGQSVPFLDLLINIKEGVISTSIFDKRDAFNFPIVNFPILSGNIPNRSSYGVFYRGSCSLRTGLYTL